MGAVGGDILEITWNHPTLGSGNLLAKSNEDSTFDLGGFRSDDDTNMIDSGGNMIDKINRVRPNFECTVSSDNNTRLELEKLTDLAASPVQGNWTIAHISGAIYGLTGKPVGDLSANGNNATIALKLSGGGTMKRIN